MIKMAGQDGDISRVKAISVPIGPGEETSVQITMDEVVQFGIDYDIPVVPVSSSEAAILEALNKPGCDISFPILSLAALPTTT